MKESIKKTMTFNEQLLLIKAAHNGSINAEDMLYSYHKNRLEQALCKYELLHAVRDDLPHHIESNYRIAIHKYNVESNVEFINFASWFIQNILERRCVEASRTDAHQK